MAVNKLETHVPVSTTPNGGRIEVSNDGLVFNVRAADGSVTSSLAITMADLIARKDVHALILYAMFMQNSQVVQAVERQKKAVEDMGDPWDPKRLTERMMPMMNMLKPLMESAGIDANAVGGAEKVMKALTEGTTAPSISSGEQGHGITRRELKE